MNAAATTQLSKAIVSGAEKGVFVLPKGGCSSTFVISRSHIILQILGPSGKVKLAPKVKAEAVKEIKKDVRILVSVDTSSKVIHYETRLGEEVDQACGNQQSDEID